MKFLGPDSRGAACLESDRWRARFLLGQIDCPTYFLYICVGGGPGWGRLGVTCSLGGFQIPLKFIDRLGVSRKS